MKIQGILAGLLLSGLAWAQPSPRIEHVLREIRVEATPQVTNQQSYDDWLRWRGRGEELWSARERRPDLVVSAYDRLPNRVEVYEFLYEHREKLSEDGQKWLRRRGPYFRPQLISAAAKGNLADLAALIRLDPIAADAVTINFSPQSTLWWASRAFGNDQVAIETLRKRAETDQQAASALTLLQEIPKTDSGGSTQGSVDDLLEGLLDYARQALAGYYPKESSAVRELTLGRPAPPQLLTLLARRVDTLDRNGDPLAAELQGAIGELHGSAVDEYILEQIRQDTIQGPLLLRLRARRQTLANLDPAGLRNLLSLGGEKAGIAAYLLSDPTVLSKPDEPAIYALLALSRLDRRPLPIDLVAPLLHRPSLRLAALAYLRAEDSPAARAFLVKEGQMVGLPGGFLREQPAGLELQFQEELTRSAEMEETYALLIWEHHPRQSPVFLRIQRDGWGRISTYQHYGYQLRGQPNLPEESLVEPDVVAEFRRYLEEKRLMIGPPRRLRVLPWPPFL